MLDDSQDPTPLLKEIRDDKTATIIVDANATMSHIILERVSMLLIITLIGMHLVILFDTHNVSLKEYLFGIQITHMYGAL